MQQRLAVVGQLGVDDEREVGQIEPARGHVGRHQHAGAAVAQRLQRLAAFGLAEFTRQRHRGEAALEQARIEPVDRLARGAEHDRGRRLVQAQHVDDGVLDVVRHDAVGEIIDVGVLLVAADRRDAHGLALVAPGQRLDLARQRGREQQRAALGRRAVENELQILAEAEVEHLVGFVEHDGGEAAQIQPAAFDVIAQAAGGADDDVRARLELAGLGARIHAADARDDTRARLLVEPGELAADLQRQFASRRDDEGERHGGPLHALRFAQQRAAQSKPEGDRLARAGLGRDEQIAPARIFFQHGRLHGGRDGIAARCEGARERRMGGRKGHDRWSSDGA